MNVTDRDGFDALVRAAQTGDAAAEKALGDAYAQGNCVGIISGF